MLLPPPLKRSTNSYAPGGVNPPKCPCFQPSSPPCRRNPKSPPTNPQHSEFFSLQTYRHTYSANLRPVDLLNLSVSADCEPMLQRKPRGRPKERRMRKGERQRKKNAARAVARAAAVGAPVDLPDHAPQRCGQCGGVGHNKRSCQDVPQVEPLIGAR
jgi:hypothetical protein